MKYRTLGNTGFRVSEIGFGAWAIGGAINVFGMPVGWSNVSDSESIAAIERAIELGINFFDTADVYGMGHSEALLGKTLNGKDCIIATKVGAIPQVLTHEQSGLVVDPSVSSLTFATSRLMQNPGLARSLGESALERVRGQYSSERMAKAYAEIFDRLCSP